MSVTLPYTFANNTVADADQVNANFQAVATGTTPEAFGGDIKAAGDTGKRVIYGGTYTYTNTANPSLAGGIEKLPGAVVNGSIISDIMAFDPDNRLVGLHHNHTQITSTASPITSGVITAPPLSTAAIAGPVDIVAHWYNDFGREYNRTNGAATWYTWQWNHVGNTGDGITSNGYDASRHPLLGWYRGDDQNVLDWQCYWLREYGVTGVSLVNSYGINTATWSTPSDNNYWLYQLFNNVPNFKGLRYIPWVAYTSSAGDKVADLTANWTNIISNICAVYPNTYTVTKSGKKYLCLYVWNGELLRGALDGYGGGTSIGAAFFKSMATLAQSHKYAGICVMSRNLGTYATFTDNASALADGYIVMPAGYESAEAATGSTYPDIVTNFTISAGNHIVNIPTSLSSQYPHPSGWTKTGSTPVLFEKMLKKAINQINDTNLPNIITIYNVSEWAEGGPGLQPNRRDGFGYLQAVKNALTTSASRSIPSTRTYYTYDIRGVNINPVAETIGIWSDYAANLNASVYKPTIAAGTDGQRIRIFSWPNPAVGAGTGYAYTLHDDGEVSGTNLFLNAPVVIIKPYEFIDLMYVAGKGWVQTGGITTFSPRSGTATPAGSVLPRYIGDMFVDTSGGKVYSAKGLTTSDWLLLN